VTGVPHLRSALRFAAALALVAVAARAAAIELEIRNAWARPMAKGYPVARVYLDIRSDSPLKLVGATSPAATSVALVSAGIKPDGRDERPVEVREIDVAAGHDTRLALNGDYLELREVLEDKSSGTTIPLRLEFVDAAGMRHVAEAVAIVRGITLQPPPEPAARMPQTSLTPQRRSPAAETNK
jgi:copper(I)-binding protein